MSTLTVTKHHAAERNAPRQVVLDLPGEDKRALEAMQREVRAVKAAVASAGEGASLDAAGGGGEMRRTILDLYCRTATLKVRPAATS